jgi:hypothetical protein
MFAAAVLLLYDNEVEIPSKRLGLRKVSPPGARRDGFSSHSSSFPCLREPPADSSVIFFRDSPAIVVYFIRA